MSDDPITDAVAELLPDMRARTDGGGWRTTRPLPVICLRCRGEGTIKAKRARWNPDGWSRQPRIACPTCNGEGTI